MAVRIYALAKDLNIDGKELVDICARAGVTGKGSALASLSDDEVEKLKQFMNGGGSSPKATATQQAPPPPTRPAETSRGERMRVIVAPKSRALPSSEPAEAKPAPVAPQKPVAAEGSSEEIAAAAAAPAKPPQAEPKPTPDEAGQGPLAGMLRREDYIGPGGAGGRPPMLGGSRGAGLRDAAAKPKRTGDNAPKPRPVVKLAAMPAPAQPAPPKKKKEDEAPAQKPDMKLPAEVMGGGRLGAKPLAAHLKRAERTLEAEKIRAKSGTGVRKDVEEEDTSRGKGPGRGRGRGTGAPAAGEDKSRPMLGGREQRQLSRTRSRGPRSNYDGGRRRSFKRGRSGVNTAAPRKDAVTIELPCTVRDLSEAIGVPAAHILKILMSEGVMSTITAMIEPDLAEFVAAELGAEVNFQLAETLEDKLLSEIDDFEDDEESLVHRPPVITFLGHVDHGKTSLLDRIIGIQVAKGESGGITQHIRAYQIDNGGKPISFVDTPGHAAFTEMRARGANVTDIAVIVVAADDGVMPQTEEAISHAKAAGVPIVVAMNKTDLPGFDPLKTLTGLSTCGIVPSEWGGDVEVVKTSAATGAGIEELLETLLTVAELQDYRANPDRPAVGVCLDSQQGADSGVAIKLIVERGTLHVGDVVVCGDGYGKVKAMVDPLTGQRIDAAGPSRPVDVFGLDAAPSAGERFYVLDDIAQAREIAEDRADRSRATALGSNGFQHVTLETLFERLEGDDEVQTLNLILRADVRGSIEAIEKELSKLQHPEVRLRILQRSVGGVSEADVALADASDAVVIGFNVVPDEKARAKAAQLGVEIRRYEVIYKISDDLRAAMEGMLKPEERELSLGTALVQATFKISRLGVIAGCRVIAGAVARDGRMRVVRDSTVVGDYAIDSLKREKDDAKEVRDGYECGIKLVGFNDIKEGDLLECYKIEKISRTFDDR